MNKNKATKVPVMRKDQQYIDWKKELKVWEATNTVLGVDKRIQAGILFESLDGIPRQTVLSELSVLEITNEDGVLNIIKTLDEFFIGNETKNAFSAIEDLMQYKREKGLSLDKFIVEFQLKVNKCKASGTNLSVGVLGYALLNAANLPEDKCDMIKATCDEPTYKNVKCQLEKTGLGNSSLGWNKGLKFKAEPETSKVKIEQSFYGNTQYERVSQDRESSSDEDLNGERVYYSENRVSFGNQSRNKKPKINPTDRFGHVRPCIFCQCLYHWVVDCPYAPVDFKNNLKSKDKQYKGYSKPL